MAPATKGNDSPTTGSAPPQVAPVLHTETESTLAPTSEFVRYLLLALPSRYIFRGFFGTIFNEKKQFPGNGPLTKIESLLRRPGDMVQRMFSRTPLESKEALGYNAALGAGSMALTLSYSNMVYRDIRSLFAEAVGEELGKPAQDIRFADLTRSQNKIVQKTIANYRGKLMSRLAVDFLFFPAALMRNTHLGDAVLGIKGVQALVDTWKRKTTMFEDLSTFVNNKINPRNGLGQPISSGEVFDLYQHYADQFQPDKMFRNVLERGTGEGLVWAKSQPLFQRMAELMNHTYAYKHHIQIDPQTGRAVIQADFALPKFIHLLGHGLIDPYAPERTQAYIEIANARGIAAVQTAQAAFAAGASVGEVVQQLGLSLPAMPQAVLEPGPNATIAKGSTVQVESAPVAHIRKEGLARSGNIAQAQAVALGAAV